MVMPNQGASMAAGDFFKFLFGGDPKDRPTEPEQTLHNTKEPKDDPGFVAALAQCRMNAVRSAEQSKVCPCGRCKLLVYSDRVQAAMYGMILEAVYSGDKTKLERMLAAAEGVK